MPHLADIRTPNSRNGSVGSVIFFVVITTIMTTVMSVWYAQRFFPQGQLVNLKVSQITLSYNISPKTTSSVLQFSDEFEHRIVAATMSYPSPRQHPGVYSSRSETVTLDPHFSEVFKSPDTSTNPANKNAIVQASSALSPSGFGLVLLSPNASDISGSVQFDFRAGQNRTKIQLIQAPQLKPTSFQIRASSLVRPLLHRQQHSTGTQLVSDAHVVSMEWFDHGELDIELIPGDSTVLHVPTEHSTAVWSGTEARLTLSEEHSLKILRVLNPDPWDWILNHINVPRSCSAHAGSKLTLTGVPLNIDRFAHVGTGTFDISINGIEAISGVACTPTNAFSALWFCLLSAFGVTAILATRFKGLILKVLAQEEQ